MRVTFTTFAVDETNSCPILMYRALFRVFNEYWGIDLVRGSKGLHRFRTL